MSKAPDLTRAEFEAWLRSLPPEQVFAFARGDAWMCSCPLSSYLRQGDDWVKVGVLEFTTSTACRVPLPEWALQFRRLADKEVMGKSVLRAARCLELLARVPEDRP